MAEQEEENKTEDPTPFKLKKGREKGMIARGADLGYFSMLLGLTGFLVVLGPDWANSVAQDVATLIGNSSEIASSPSTVIGAISNVYRPTLQALALLGATVLAVIIFFELIQIRGPVFTTKPLKPDFNKLNPAKGFKRLFSFKMLKETLKNVLKMAIYATVSVLTVQYAIGRYAESITDADSLVTAMRGSGLRLLFAYLIVALLIAAIDQAISRSEFLKQMRMSKSEVKKEMKDREGEPRLKQKRKELHASFAKQSQALGDLPGSDVLIVNPQHYAVGLAYDNKTMEAPTVTAKGRNKFALLLKEQARNHRIPVVELPPLARALYRATEAGQEVPQSEFRAVADIYLQLTQMRPPASNTP